MIKELIVEIIVNAELDRTRFIMIRHVKKSVLFHYSKKVSNDAFFYASMILSEVRDHKKISLKSYKTTREHIQKIILQERATRYIIKNNVLIYLIAVIEFLNDHM